MVTLVNPSWVESHLGASNVLVLDPRGRMKHLRGHLKGAISLPATRFFGTDGRLLPPDKLAKQFGEAGLGDSTLPLLYDSFDGQKGAMAAWVLEYLGRSDVHLMDTFFEGWASQGREVLYRPVDPTPREFQARVTPAVRASSGDVQGRGQVRLLDTRSVEEFSGQSEIDDRPGHIPGAINVDWRQFLGAEHDYLDSREGTTQLLDSAGISPGDSMIAYCRMGMRAAVGYLALQRLGYDVRLYDGSYAEWADAGLPVETSG